MKLSRIGRVSMALAVSVAMGLGMTACGGGTVGYMWVMGKQYNQITGFKIDDFTGNLTQIVGMPIASGGTDPESIVVKPGGRYVYVVNTGQGTATTGSDQCTAGYGISEFAVGGQGVLTFQNCFSSQGERPVWAIHDSTGNYLYVLDQFGYGSTCAANPDKNPPWTPVAPASCYGDITVFSADPNTGRLSLVLNQQIKDPTTGLQVTYFPVGTMPTMMTLAGSCVFTLNADQTVYPYGAGGTAGQLTQTTNSIIQLGTTKASSIQTGGSSVYVTDTGATNSPGQILPFTVGSTGCSLNTVTGGATQNLVPAANPVYTLVDSTNAYLYVANQSSTNSSTPNSTISAFNILTNGTLQGLSNTAATNPYPIGAGPVCMVEDPSDQYIYTSNGDGTVTGKILDRRTGQLSDLNRGSTFTAVGQATCLAISGNVD